MISFNFIDMVEYSAIRLDNWWRKVDFNDNDEDFNDNKLWC